MYLFLMTMSPFPPLYITCFIMLHAKDLPPSLAVSAPTHPPPQRDEVLVEADSERSQSLRGSAHIYPNRIVGHDIAF